MIYILVPYRNREKQLEIFTKYTKYLFKVKEKEVRIIICYQNNDKPFNRGLILNKGFMFLLNLNQLKNDDLIILNDIDCICPEDSFDIYTKDPLDTIRHIYGYNQLFHNIFYSLGGVISFHPNTFLKTNGFPNNYYGWGAEDLALGMRAELTNIKIENGDLILINDSKFYQFENPIEEPKLEDRLKSNSLNLIKLIHEIRDVNQIKTNGLSNIKKELIKIEKYRDYEMFYFIN
jgi:hypothetical protein